jgi:hypothetical protein
LSREREARSFCPGEHARKCVGVNLSPKGYKNGENAENVALETQSYKDNFVA